MQLLVSIIIPTYNRSHLIGETIKSIIDQSYINWECIVVDDGSNDETEKLLHSLSQKDSRIKYLRRPEFLPKGANSCRNFGLGRSKGVYVQFFDSDDLMVPTSLQKRIDILSNNDLDFAVAKLVNFRKSGDLVEQYYNRTNKEILFSDFLFRKINWITPDAIIKREVLEKHEIKFNELFNSDQEYNFFCKLLLRTERGVYLEEVLTKRRLHQKSIQGKINRNSDEYRRELFKNWYLNMKDLHPIRGSALYSEYLNQVMTISFTNSGLGIWSRYNIVLWKEVYIQKGLGKTIYFLTSILTNFVLKKGFRLLEWSKY